MSLKWPTAKERRKADTILTGNGSPNGWADGVPGQMYLRMDGREDQAFYVNVSPRRWKPSDAKGRPR